MGVYLPQGLTNTLWALARLDVQPPTSWMARFLEVSYVVLPAMNQQVRCGRPSAHTPRCNGAHLHLLRSPDQTSLHRQDGPTPTTHRPAFCLIPERVRWCRLHVRRCGLPVRVDGVQELTNLVASLAKLRCWPDRLWMSRYDAQAAALMHTFSPTSVSLTLRALVVLRCGPRAATPPTARAAPPPLATPAALHAPTPRSHSLATTHPLHPLRHIGRAPCKRPL